MSFRGLVAFASLASSLLLVAAGVRAGDLRDAEPIPGMSAERQAQSIVDDLNTNGGSFGLGIRHGDFAHEVKALDDERERAITRGDWDSANFLENKALRRQRYLEFVDQQPPMDDSQEPGISRGEWKQRVEGSVSQSQERTQKLEELAVEEWRAEESYYRSRGLHDKADEAARNLHKLEVNREVGRLWEQQIEEKSRQAAAEAKAGEEERARLKARWDRDLEKARAKYQAEFEARQAEFERQLPARRAQWARDQAAKGLPTGGITVRPSPTTAPLGTSPNVAIGAGQKPATSQKVGALDKSFSWGQPASSKPKGFEFGAGTKPGSTFGGSSSYRFGAGSRLGPTFRSGGLK